VEVFSILTTHERFSFSLTLISLTFFDFTVSALLHFVGAILRGRQEQSLVPQAKSFRKTMMTMTRK